MTELLAAAFEAAAELTPLEQEWIAEEILAYVRGDLDADWDRRLAVSLPQLDKLAADARHDHSRHLRQT